MPWNNQNGGGWKSGGGGGGGGPWGQGPWGGQGGGGGGGGGNNQQPDLEEIFKRGQDRLKQVMPGGGIGGGFIALLLALAVAAWFASGIYVVRPNEFALNLVLGRYIGPPAPEGLKYNWPAPIGQVIKVPVTEVKLTQVGNTGTSRVGRGMATPSRETLMLTGDGNIIDVSFDVQWQVDASKVVSYVFNLKNPEETVRAVAESAMREVVGKRELQPILNDRGPLATDAQKVMQDTLNGYGAGINIVSLQLKVDPPAEVADAFNSVPNAQQEQVRLQNLAEAYRNRVVPEAKGAAAKIVQDAEAYRERSVAEAQGQASRFSQVYEEYRRAPDVTRQRLFIETMEKVYSTVDKTIIDGRIGGGVTPFLGLDRRGSVPPPIARPEPGSVK